MTYFKKIMCESIEETGRPPRRPTSLGARPPRAEDSCAPLEATVGILWVFYSVTLFFNFLPPGSDQKVRSDQGSVV